MTIRFSAVLAWSRFRFVRQPRKDLNDHDTTNQEWGLSTGHQRGPELSTSGDFFMATDATRGDLSGSARALPEPYGEPTDRLSALGCMSAHWQAFVP